MVDKKKNRVVQMSTITAKQFAMAFAMCEQPQQASSSTARATASPAAAAAAAPARAPKRHDGFVGTGVLSRAKKGGVRLGAKARVEARANELLRLLRLLEPRACETRSSPPLAPRLVRAPAS